MDKIRNEYIRGTEVKMWEDMARGRIVAILDKGYCRPRCQAGGKEEAHRGRS